MDILTFLGPNSQFLGSGQSSKTVFGSIYPVEHLLFSMVPSILAFGFDLILGLFLFLEPLWAILGLG